MRTLFIALLAAGLACAEETKFMHSDKLGIEFVIPEGWKPVPSGKATRSGWRSDKGSLFMISHGQPAPINAKFMFAGIEETYDAQFKNFKVVEVTYSNRVVKNDCFEMTFSFTQEGKDLNAVQWMFLDPNTTWTLLLMSESEKSDDLKTLARKLIDGFRTYSQGYETPKRAIDTLLLGMKEQNPDLFLRSFIPDRCAEFGNEAEYAKLSDEDKKALHLALHQIRTRDHLNGFYAKIEKQMVRMDEVESTDESAVFRMVGKTEDGKEYSTQIRLEKMNEGWRVIEMCDAAVTETK